MFRTVKSKVIITAIVMLTFLTFAFALHTIISRMKTKQLMVQNYGFSINSFSTEVNSKISKMEDNLKSLALIGGLFYQTDRSGVLTDKVITRIFENYPETLGGGIWFKPYVVDKSKKYVCFYAYRNKDNKVVIDRNFESAKYDYPNQGWYKQVMSKVTPERNIVWTKPYYENQGSYTMMVTAGTGIYVGNELVGIATVDWEISSVIDEVSKMKPFEKTFSMYKSGGEIKNSIALLGNIEYDYIMATNDPNLDNDALVGHSLKEIPWYADNLYAITYITYRGKKYIPFFRKMSNGMVLVICIPKSAMFKSVNEFYMYMVLLVLFVVLIVPALLYYSMNHYIINPIDKLIDIAKKISNGEDIQIRIENPEEFAQLADTYDKMTKDIKSITQERAKINSELSIAKSIQASSLPSVFPPFPEKKEFDIFALMEPAKEVGGDFYDFFFLNENEFMFLLADVSGKGVPAALFMMTVKTLINNFAQVDCSKEQLMESINKKICETNKQGFFVTMLAGIVNIKTGELTVINCGHNLPLIKRLNESYEYLQLEPNIPLGIFEDAKYEVYKTVINHGDIIYAYTDGVTESTNISNKMFGERRLKDCLNTIEDDDVNLIAQKVKESVHKYADTVPQSDDITMLIFKYNGKMSDTKSFKQTAIKENYKAFADWLHSACKEWDIDDELANKLDMCAEEIFANVAFYAYSDGNGIFEAVLNKSENNIIFEFTDEGKEYNPLKKPDPDITLPPEDRPLGGLGIYMVKEMADKVSYKRENNKNILTLIFKI
ncbi:MAG: SpoIIE family protein phosphatase [bacterium]|nr:SpoIIE family protein phosphatase [bacterium]